MLRDGRSGAARVLRRHGLSLPAARDALGRLTDRGVVPGPRPSDAERFGVDFGGLDYDFFLLFDREATWDATPPRPVSSGATVIGDSDQLAESAASVLR